MTERKKQNSPEEPHVKCYLFSFSSNEGEIACIAVQENLVGKGLVGKGWKGILHYKLKQLTAN